MVQVRLWAVIFAVVVVFDFSVLVLYFASQQGRRYTEYDGVEDNDTVEDPIIHSPTPIPTKQSSSATNQPTPTSSPAVVTPSPTTIITKPKPQKSTPTPTFEMCEDSSGLIKRAFHVYDVPCKMEEKVTSPHPNDFLRVAHQHFIYSTEVEKARKQLGECYDNFKVNWCFHPGPDIGPWHQGGPRKVINNLASGLREIGYEWGYCDYDFDKYNTTYISDPWFMNEANLETPDAPNMFKPYGGKKIYIGPNVEDRIMADPNFHVKNLEKLLVVSASEWHMESRGLHPKCVSQGRYWPVGVDTHCFTPGKDEERTDILVMAKHRDHKVVTDYLNSNGIAYTLMVYGGYHESDFIDNLKKAKFCILIDGSETQGLANQEMMAMDVPLLVLDHDPTSVPYFSDLTGMVTSEAAFGANYVEFVKKLAAGAFKPRKYILENLSLSQAAIDLLLMLCDKPNRWQKDHVPGSHMCINNT